MVGAGRGLAAAASADRAGGLDDLLHGAVGVPVQLVQGDRPAEVAAAGGSGVVVDHVPLAVELDDGRVVGGRGDLVEHHAPLGPRPHRVARGGVANAGVARRRAARVVGRVGQVVGAVALEHPGRLPEVRDSLRGDDRAVQRDHVRVQPGSAHPVVGAPVHVDLAVVVGEDGRVDVERGRTGGAVADQRAALGVGERAGRGVADRDTDVHPSRAVAVDRGVPVVLAVVRLDLAGPGVGAGPREGRQGHLGPLVGERARVGRGEDVPVTHDEVGAAGGRLVVAGVEVQGVPDDQGRRVGGVDRGGDRGGGLGRPGGGDECGQGDRGQGGRPSSSHAALLRVTGVIAFC